jgi:hypothetical protein
LACACDGVSVCLSTQRVTELQGQLDKYVLRRVSVVWFGVAQDVRLMGSFDNWTRGHSLSAEIADSVFTKFHAEVELLPVRRWRDR